MRLKKWSKDTLNKIRLFRAALKKFNDDNGFLLSSGIAFNLLIALIPLILLLLSLLGTYLYSDREVLNHIGHHLEDMAPSIDPEIMNNILAIIHDRKIVGILGIGGLIWSATFVFGSLRTALNIVFQVERGQGFLRGMANDLFVMFLAWLFHLASMGITSVTTYLHTFYFSLFMGMGLIIGFFLKYLLPFFFTFGMFFMIYKIIPNKIIHFMIAFKAAFFTSLLWEIAKQCFGWYVLHLASFSMVYGSLSTLVIFVLWVYYSSVILLLGGEVAFLLEKERNRIHG